LRFYKFTATKNEGVTVDNLTQFKHIGFKNIQATIMCTHNKAIAGWPKGKIFRWGQKCRTGRRRLTV